jgi:hypothetical protein
VKKRTKQDKMMSGVRYKLPKTKKVSPKLTPKETEHHSDIIKVLEFINETQKRFPRTSKIILLHMDISYDEFDKIIAHLTLYTENK